LFYFGEFSVDTIFDFFILYRYSSMLEQHSFRNKPAEFILFIIFGSSVFLLAAIFLGLEFLSPCLSGMMLYLWARRNPTVQINFLEIFQFRAPFLPWFLLLFVVMFGFNPKYDLIGLTAGHLYYYLEDVVPKIPETEDCKVLRPPKYLVQICSYLQIHDYRLNEEELIFEEEVAAAAAAVAEVAEANNRAAQEGIIDENMIDDDAMN
jgi:Der1-like family